MRRRGALLLLLLGAALPAAAAEADKAAIQSVIAAQIEAFRRDDAAGAYRFAAPGIKQMFPSPEGFMALVRERYAPVYRPRDVEFGALVERGGALQQDVELVGPDGAPALARYTMERGADGEWRIAGCEILPSARLVT